MTVLATIKGLELGIFVFLFGVVTVLGFVAARWRRAESLAHLDEWGLGGRKFGSWVSWFLLGGDLYTAYTFVALPALLFGVGATGFFALPYTIIMFPMAFIVAPRLWSVAHRHGYVTPADFVRGRHGSGTLALAIALTGIVATMPYIALQLVGIGAVMRTMGISGDWPLIIAFVILAAYTYQSGLRAPALIAFVKDSLIYIVVIVAVIYIPIKLHGFHHIFSAADAKFSKTPVKTDGVLLKNAQILGFSTLAFGSALAIWLYPHSVTGVLAANRRDTIRRNMAALPAYTFVLGLLALLGLMAIAAKVTPLTGASGKPDSNTVVPLLFDKMFPDWFAGVAFAAIGIGALVPAAVMSIAAANLFTRNVYKEYLRRDASPAEEARVSRLASLVVKGGAVAVILLLDPSFSIELQLIGGVIVVQTLPAVVIGLYTRALHAWGLLLGWAVGLTWGVIMVYQTPDPATGKAHFGSASYALSHFGLNTKATLYAGVIALAANLVVAIVASAVLRVVRAPQLEDRTAADDYLAEADEPGVEPAPATPAERTAAPAPAR